MEPENHLLEEEHHLPSLHFRFHVDFQGCTVTQPSVSETNRVEELL